MIEFHFEIRVFQLGWRSVDRGGLMVFDWRFALVQCSMKACHDAMLSTARKLSQKPLTRPYKESVLSDQQSAISDG